jgi:hypothetical protein
MFEQLSRLKINFDKSEILLYIFEQLSRLKINFDKSEILLVGGDNIAMTYAEIFNCQIGSFPLRYLGVPIASGRLHVPDWVKVRS